MGEQTSGPATRPSATRPSGPVLIVSASTDRRGAEIQASQLVAELTARGVDVELVALSLGGRSDPLPTRVLGRRRLGLRTLWELRRAAGRAAVVVAYGSSTLPACCLALVAHPTPFVYRSISRPDHWIRGRVHRWLTALQYRRADHVVALWDGAAETIRHQYAVRPSRLSVIPNARDGRHFRPPTPTERDAARQVLGLDGRALGLIGGLSPEKRPQLALDAAALLSDAVLIVVGDGHERGTIELAARELGDRVRFLGERRDVRPILHALDVLVITSRTEGMPGAAIEAAMCGVPIVATDAGALAEMPGVVIVPPNPDAIAAAIATQPGDRPRPSMAAYDWSVVATRWQELLDAVITSREATGAR